MRKGDSGPLAAAILERCRQERREERDALMAALVQEYAALVARDRCDPNRMPDRDREWYVRGGCDALRRVAERLGVTDLHERAAAVVARGEAS